MNVRFSNEHLIALQMTDKEVMILDANAWLLSEEAGTNAISGDNKRAEPLDPDCDPTADATNEVAPVVSISLNDFSPPGIICDVEFATECEASVWNKHYWRRTNFSNCSIFNFRFSKIYIYLIRKNLRLQRQVLLHPLLLLSRLFVLFFLLVQFRIHRHHFHRLLQYHPKLPCRPVRWQNYSPQIQSAILS